MAAERTEVVRADGAEIVRAFAQHHQLGEHVAIVGPTGSGKSVLALALLQERGRRKGRDGRPVRIAVLANKNRDKTMQALGWPRLRRQDEWPPGYAKEQCVVWPPYGNAKVAPSRQRPVFEHVIVEASESGGQIVFVDEVAYFTEAPPEGLRMGPLLGQLWATGRSSQLSLFGATQRPRKVPISMWTESTWLFVFRLRDREDIRRVADFGERELLFQTVPQLRSHEFLMIHQETREAVVGRL